MVALMASCTPGGAPKSGSPRLSLATWAPIASIWRARAPMDIAWKGWALRAR